MSLFEWQTWVIETGGDIIEKKANHGLSSLTPIERLIYCLWVADYGMCNAGDLETASDLYADFQTEGAVLAKELGLTVTAEAFLLPTNQLEKTYFDRFEDICSELAAANH